jgi:hypothetical protein
MATVGNLFVNVRGRTGGFVRDMKRAHKSVRKDFYVNEAMAMQNLRKARERVGFLNLASPERFAAGMKGLRVSEARLSIAKNRPGRLAERRGLIAAKERGEAARAFLAREAKALIPLVFGVPAAALALVVRQGVKAFTSASRFAVMGPQGGRVVGANVGKMMDEMAFAQRPDVSNVMAKTAELERANANLWREVGLQFQIVMNAVMESLGLSMSDYMSPAIKGDAGFVPGAVDERARMLLKQRQAQIAGQEFMRQAFGPYFGGYDS